MKHLPNILSVLRIFLSLSLLFLQKHELLFIIVYFACGISDVLDGYIARKFELVSDLGAKLDSIGDFILYTTSLFIIITNMEINLLVIGLASFVLVWKVVNLVYSKVKFDTWGSIHTLGVKATGFSFFLFLPICVTRKVVPMPLIWVIFIISLAATIEVSFILKKAKTIDLNTKGYFFMKEDNVEEIEDEARNTNDSD